MKKIALILGITGQDGSYLAEFLIKKKYQVHGIKRRTSTPNTSRIDHIFDSVNFNNKNLTMHHGDLSDVGSLNRIINEINPDEIYNLAAQSHVKISFQIPEYTSDVNALGPLRLLEIIRHYKKKKIKFYQASSSEMFGKSKPPKMKTLYLNQDLFMQYLKFLLITLLSTIEKLIIYMLVMVYYSIMSRLVEVLILLQKKLSRD